MSVFLEIRLEYNTIIIAVLTFVCKNNLLKGAGLTEVNFRKF